MAKRGDNHRDSAGKQQRTRLAQEAARLMSEHGIADYRTAKGKAALSLGLQQQGALPSNLEIETALAERNRIFGAGEHNDLLCALRVKAVELMQDFLPFRPYLVGPVLSGNVTAHSVIVLHLFSEPAEQVSLHLDNRGIRYQLTQRRCRISRDRNDDIPAYTFSTGSFRVEVLVFPERRRGHPPLSPLDGKPMRRAGLRQAQSLAAQRFSTAM